jgi:transposase
VQHLAGFVYGDERFVGDKTSQAIEVRVSAHAGIRARCSHCHQPAPGYDCLPERRWQFVPLWGIPVWFLYASRRVECAEHGVVVEHIPWSDGKRPVTLAMMGYLARWARRLSWRETAEAFQVSWEAVYRSVEWFVEWLGASRVTEY